MEKISEHVSYKEGVKSNTASRLGIDNTPSAYELSIWEYYVITYLSFIKKMGWWTYKNDFFRCEDLNRAIGEVQAPALPRQSN